MRMLQGGVGRGVGRRRGSGCAPHGPRVLACGRPCTLPPASAPDGLGRPLQVLGQLLPEAEVDKYAPGRKDADIIKLDVAMQDALLVDLLEQHQQRQHQLLDEDVCLQYLCLPGRQRFLNGLPGSTCGLTPPVGGHAVTPGRCRSVAAAGVRRKSTPPPYPAYCRWAGGLRTALVPGRPQQWTGPYCHAGPTRVTWWGGVEVANKQHMPLRVFNAGLAHRHCLAPSSLCPVRSLNPCTRHSQRADGRVDVPSSIVRVHQEAKHAAHPRVALVPIVEAVPAATAAQRKHLVRQGGRAQQGTTCWTAREHRQLDQWHSAGTATMEPVCGPRKRTSCRP